MRAVARSGILALAALSIGCGGDDRPAATPAPATTVAAAPVTTLPPAPPPVQRDPLTGGPAPTLALAQAQFISSPSGQVPGPGRLVLVRFVGGAWKTVTVDDPDSNAIHKALFADGGLLTIGANQALLRTWTFANDAWQAVTHWNPKFGGKFDRLRDIERGDVDGDGKDEYVIATHDQGVIAVLHPDENWRVEEVDRQPDMFVHEIEIGDVDGDGRAEFFATPSKPNKLDQEQPGEVRMYRFGPKGFERSVVDAPTDTHAKEILAADTDGDKKAELFVVWEGAIGAGNALVRPVTIKQYRWNGTGFTSSEIGTIPDRLTRALAAGDVNGDGKIDLVAGAMSSGLWLFEQDGKAWKRSLIDAQSSGFEHPVCLADLDGDGKLEIYVVSEDQHELRRYTFANGAFVKTVIAPLRSGDITWNVTAGTL